MEAGEEVDHSSVCIKETDALTKYMLYEMNYYKESHPLTINDKKQKYFTPK